MTAALRTLAFGELEAAGAWGAAWATDPDDPTLATLGAGREWSVLPDLRLSRGEGTQEWRLTGPAATLLVAPVGEAVATRAAEDGIEASDQLCRVTGRFLERDGAERAVECLGLRSWFSPAIELERYESIRAVSSWFGPDDGMALAAFRPRKAKAHDRDVLAATVIAADGSAPVEDSRLSTTYAEGGWPVRAGLELWVAGEEPDQQYPRRASGEAKGARAQALSGSLELRAEPFHWHSRGRDGAGMYLLAHRR
ncbi:MAG: hypothetical protein JO243_14470 [Solirubrobacterales bacterium]|nr:hypothetical protein [Solirubrobacterales bacterium]MBV9337086.1 hypothetical protein [Solirubrobacterales bacterium]